MTAYPDEFDPSLSSAVKDGRGAPFTIVGEWVVMADISHLACRVYWLLRGHVNSTRKDDDGQVTNIATPMLTSLAGMLRLKKPDTVSAAIRELVEIGAVDIEVQRYKGGMRQRNIYTVHRDPPEGYAGVLSTNHWHDIDKGRAEAANPQVTPEPRFCGGPETEGPERPPRTPARTGVRTPRKTGARTPRRTGRNQTNLQPHEG